MAQLRRHVASRPLSSSIHKKRRNARAFSSLTARGGGLPQEFRLTVVVGTESTAGGFKFPDGSVQTSAAVSDGRSLDASVGDPVDALTVDEEGRVGIGATSTTSVLHVR